MHPPLRFRPPSRTLSSCFMLLVALGVISAWVTLYSPPASSAKPYGQRPPPEVLQLWRALREARMNCARSHLELDQPQAYDTRELRLALASNPLLLEGEQGELEALQEEADWLAQSHMGPNREIRSGEDRRYLLGFFHWYLAASCHGHLPPTSRDLECESQHRYRHEELRAFRGLTFVQLLGAWD